MSIGAVCGSCGNAAQVSSECCLRFSKSGGPALRGFEILESSTTFEKLGHDWHVGSKERVDEVSAQSLVFSAYCNCIAISSFPDMT